MSNIHVMPGGTVPPGEPVKAAVELLENLLVKAKSGELRAVAVSYMLGERRIVTDWHSDTDYFALIGGVGWLHQRMLEGSKIEPVD